jgi:hypothetical protein
MSPGAGTPNSKTGQWSAFDHKPQIAVVGAAARWLEEPSGDEYAWALLGAVSAPGRTLPLVGARARGGLVGV